MLEIVGENKFKKESEYLIEELNNKRSIKDINPII